MKTERSLLEYAIIASLIACALIGFWLTCGDTLELMYHNFQEVPQQ